MKRYQRAILNQEAREQIRILNEQRAEQGMPPVQLGTGLLKAAGIVFFLAVIAMWFIKG